MEIKINTIIFKCNDLDIKIILSETNFKKVFILNLGCQVD